MFKRVQAARPLVFGFCLGLFACTVPPLESEFEGGPTVSDIVRHINCELATIVNANNDQILSEIEAENRLPPSASRRDSVKALLHHLTKDHFVAAVSMTLDVLGVETANPTVNFVTPLYNSSSTFNSVFSVGASLSGTQERNINVSYSVDLDQLKNTPGTYDREDKYCKAPERNANQTAGDTRSQVGLNGDLGLTTIVVDGLRGLNASSSVNVYGGSGPIIQATTYPISDWRLALTPIPPSPSPPTPAPPGPSPAPSPPSANPQPVEMDFTGALTFTPSSTDATLPGTVSLTGSTTNAQNDNYFVSLTGSTLPAGNTISFSLSGTMTQVNPITDGSLAPLGFSPKLNLTGSIASDYKTSLVLGNGLVTKDTTNGTASDNFTATLHAPPQTPVSANVTISSLSGSGPGSPTKSSSSGGGGSTQFGSLINFILSYGINGGPTWTIRTFRGPGAGSGPLVSATRTLTDTVTLTFVAACSSASVVTSPYDYWSSLPHCDSGDTKGIGAFRAQAVSAGFTNNLLILNSRGF